MKCTLRIIQTVFLARRNVRKIRTVELSGVHRRKMENTLEIVLVGRQEYVLMIMKCFMIITDMDQDTLATKVTLEKYSYNFK